MIYEAKWESINSRPIPSWFDQAKLGIFIHWGVYSVPAWAPKRYHVNSTGEAYAEWYGEFMQRTGGPVWEFHQRIYSDKHRYQDFVPSFKAELFNPTAWAELFYNSGAGYVTLTAKHHDGFCLWPSRYSWNWNSVDVGPHRDLVGELSAAVKSRGMRMGLYYSLTEWFRPLRMEDPRRYAREHMVPQMKELIEKYEPSLLFTDGEWEYPSEVWDSCSFLEWLFNQSAVMDEIVINDRWGSETRSWHGGYFTTEYGEVSDGRELSMDQFRKWEECRSIGTSFGYNRNEDISDYMRESELVHLLVDIVSKGGNLHLNVGPAADGTIPVIMQERLVQLGNWLRVNGEAIYGSRIWRTASEGEDIRYTAKDGRVYAICKRWPGRILTLREPHPAGNQITASLLGWKQTIHCQPAEDGICLELPELIPDEISSQHAYVFCLQGVE